MYYEVPVILRFDTERFLTLEDVQNFLQGQLTAVKPCEIVCVQDPEEADPLASWVQQWERMRHPA